MKLEFQEYQPRKIVNVHKHVDGPWFWTKYSAHPYVGCRSGCEFCYLRGGHYLGKRDPDSFDTLIQVKMNAVERLRLELEKLEPDVINCGDWQQPAEDRYGLSRQMLEVVLEMDFPLFIVERSPLLTRDLDLLQEINASSWVGVVMSISNIDQALKRVFEPRSPGIRRRLETMQALAEAGIQVGTTLMPIVPFAGDSQQHLEEAIIATKDHGGQFVLGGGLSMSGVQADRSFAAAALLDLKLEQDWRTLYKSDSGKPNYGPPKSYVASLGRRVRDLCQKHGLQDRMPRHIPDTPLGINKRIAEQLFLKTYERELAEANSFRVWAYHKAAWTVDELNESIADLYMKEGLAGIETLPDVGRKVAREIVEQLESSRA